VIQFSFIIKPKKRMGTCNLVIGNEGIIKLAEGIGKQNNLVSLTLNLNKYFQREIWHLFPLY